MAGGAKVWVEAGKGGNNAAAKLETYVSAMKAKLTAPVPSKHSANPDGYRQFLKREIELHSTKLAALQMGEPAKK